MKILFIILALFCIHYSLNAAIVLPPTKPFPVKKNLVVPLMGTDKFITIEEFLKLTPRSYKMMTGKKLNFDQKIDLVFSKLVIKRMIHKNGKVDSAELKQRGFFGNWQWHWGGFALGFFLSFLGPIIALFFNDDYKWDRFWTAMHAATWVALILIAIVAAGGGV